MFIKCVRTVCKLTSSNSIILKILLKFPPGKSVSTTDSFRSNEAFTHPVKKVPLWNCNCTFPAIQLGFNFIILSFCSSMISWYYPVCKHTNNSLPMHFMMCGWQFRVPMAFLEEVQPPVRNSETERGAAIDAAIVRIMKSKKTLNHQQLVNQLIKHLSAFIPDPKLIKLRVEILIEKEYLKRDIRDTKIYHYMPWSACIHIRLNLRTYNWVSVCGAVRFVILLLTFVCSFIITYFRLH